MLVYESAQYTDRPLRVTHQSESVITQLMKPASDLLHSR